MYWSSPQSEEVTEQKNLRLANLLGFAQTPSRARLLRELLDVHGILDQVFACALT